MRFQINIGVVAIGLVALAVAGCAKDKDGSEKATVTGIVTYKDQPLEGAVVTFTVKGTGTASSSTDAEGHYKIEGAPLGKAQVTVAKYEDVEGGSPDDMRKKFMSKAKKAKPKPGIPAKYANPTTSGFTAEVTSDDAANKFNFDLK